MTGQNAPAASEPDHAMERLAEICIEAHDLIEQIGVPEMKAAIETLLVRVGFGLAEQLDARRDPA